MSASVNRPENGSSPGRLPDDVRAYIWRNPDTTHLRVVEEFPSLNPIQSRPAVLNDIDAARRASGGPTA